ncbi:hypothetical protein G3G77_004877 [Salmonella enterica]|uniref:Uncharacterized protein n=1 Tax=Salmonella enterica TaxID=28901 RepID=A0A402WM65_SALER|nr:hypothetical protein [Salmonella enterica]EAS2070508.1 hypothetical protein [Salmonella enterica]ECW3987901.1 hypothetical protein [Salmonella enterica]EEG5674776.1 hypothetical protein [Salmonella enterica]EEH5466577.1 hypothetical protein [Salmonella enterica]
MNKITNNIKDINSLEKILKIKKDMSNNEFKKLLTTKMNNNEIKKQGVEQLNARTLNNIIESFTHQVKQSNIQTRKPVNNLNLTKEQQYIIEDAGKILKNRMLYSIKTNELFNNIDFTKSHFIKI